MPNCSLRYSDVEAWVRLLYPPLFMATTLLLAFVTFLTPDTFENYIFSLATVSPVLSDNSLSIDLGVYASCETADNMKGMNCTSNHLWNLTSITVAENSNITAQILEMPKGLRVVLLDLSPIWPTMFLICAVLTHYPRYPRNQVEVFLKDAAFFGGWIACAIEASLWAGVFTWLGKVMNDVEPTKVTWGNLYGVIIGMVCVNFVHMMFVTMPCIWRMMMGDTANPIQISKDPDIEAITPQTPQMATPDDETPTIRPRKGKERARYPDGPSPPNSPRLSTMSEDPH